MSDQSEVLICGHCGNSAPMNIVTVWKKDLKKPKKLSDTESTFGTFDLWNERHYQTLICMTCKKPTFRSILWSEGMGVYQNVVANESLVEVYYPQSEEISSGLPESIHKAYEAARKVKSVDANAFAVLIGRLLELVCVDQNAEGDSLFKKLKYLSEKKIIPDKLSKIAQGLREHRNIGAHAELGELTEEDVPLLEKLTRAILEYVYTAPALAEQAETQLAKLKADNAN